MTRLTAVLTTLAILVAATAAPADDVEVLVVLSRYFGGNTFLNLDQFRQHGWRITLTAVTPTVIPCPFFDASPISVDFLLSDVQSVAPYDVIAIMPASTQALGTDVYGDLLGSPHALELIASAADSGVVVSAICAGPRVLAAADCLDGISIVGSPGPGDAFLNEYLAAGAIYLGEDHAPVIDGSIVTGVRDLHYHVQNVEAIATALESGGNGASARSGAPRRIRGRTASLGDGDDLVMWSKTLGGLSAEGARSVCPTDDGGAVICGHTFTLGAGNSDVILVEVDGLGNEVWTTTFGGAGWEYGYAVAQTSDGGYILTGSTTSSGAGLKDLYLVKTDSDGSCQWEKTIGGPGVDVGCDVLEADDGGFVICGYTESWGAGEDDFYFVRTDAQGDTLWTKTFGGARSETGRSLCASDSGGILLFGSAGSPELIGSNRDFYAIGIDMEGNIIWSQNYNGDYGFSFDWGNSVCRTADGGYVLLGDGSVNWPMDAYLVRIDGSGNHLSERYFGQDFFDFGTAVIQTNEGGHLISVVTKDITTGRNDIRIIKTQPDGTPMWTETFGDSLASEWASAMCQLTDGDYLVVGQTNPSESKDSDILLVKLHNPLCPLFTGTPLTGHAPLSVSFSDGSSGNIVSWEWDLDGDGAVDSYDQHPTWVYDEPGEWSVSLTIADGEDSETLTKEDYVRVFDGESALRFDGTNSYACCPSSPDLNIVDALTVEAWINPIGWGEGSGAKFGEIVDKTKFVLTLVGPHPSITNHSLCFRMHQQDGTLSLSTTAENSILLDGWQHVAVTYCPAGGVSMYINGQPQEIDQTAPPSQPIADNGAYDLYLGNNAGHSATFDGDIDEVRVWDVVRTWEEIRAGMSDTLSGTETGLVAYWRMNEGYGGTANDATENGNDADAVDIAWVAGTPFVPTSSDDEPTALRFSLTNGYPNPFRSTTTMSYSIPEAARVRLGIYDILGREVRTLFCGVVEGGRHSVAWDGRSNSRQDSPAGVYFCRIEAGCASATSRCVLMR